MVVAGYFWGTLDKVMIYNEVIYIYILTPTPPSIAAPPSALVVDQVNLRKAGLG